MTIYTMKHDTIKFSSVNNGQVQHYEKLLNGVSEDDVKNNSIAGRHMLLVNMGLAGDCPLFEDYFRARGIYGAYYEKFLSECFAKNNYMTKVTYNRVTGLPRDVAHEYAKYKTLEKTGWIL